MILNICFFLISIALAITGSLTFWPVSHGYDFYIPIVLFIVGYLGSIVFFFILTFILGLPYSTKKEYQKPSKFASFCLSQCEQCIIFHSLARVKVIGKEKIPTKQRFLLICNHRSNFDPMIITAKLSKYQIAFITKESNFKIPLGNKFMSALCYMAIDRNDLMQSLSVMKKSASLIQNNISSIGVFPEGTRQTEKPIGDFHEGVFNIAIKSNAPIVIVTIYDAHDIHRHYPFKPSKITMKVLKVFSSEEISSLPAKKVSDMAREIMENDLNKH